MWAHVNVLKTAKINVEKQKTVFHVCIAAICIQANQSDAIAFDPVLTWLTEYRHQCWIYWISIGVSLVNWEYVAVVHCNIQHYDRMHSLWCITHIWTFWTSSFILAHHRICIGRRVTVCKIFGSTISTFIFSFLSLSWQKNCVCILPPHVCVNLLVVLVCRFSSVFGAHMHVCTKATYLLAIGGMYFKLSYANLFLSLHSSRRTIFFIFCLQLPDRKRLQLNRYRHSDHCTQYLRYWLPAVYRFHTHCC